MPPIQQQSALFCGFNELTVRISCLPHQLSTKRNASDNFGPALNKHLPVLIKLVKKREGLASRERMAEFRSVILENGGTDAMRAIMALGDLKH